MQVPVPVCINCKHFNKDMWNCKAFPNGLPDEIRINGDPHTKPLPNQKNDIVFDPIVK